MCSQSVKSLLSQNGLPPSSRGPTFRTLTSPPPAYTTSQMTAQMALGLGAEPDMDTTQSSIFISISSPIAIIGHGNVITVEPTQAAANIAQAIFGSIKEASMSSAGIPMIDEDGQPRPIHLRVDAAIKVQGTKNVVGGKAILSALPTSLPLKRKRGLTEDDEMVKAEMWEGEGTETDREPEKLKGDGAA